MADNSELLSPAAAADFLSGGLCQPKTLANWRTQGEGPPYLKIGGRVVYERSELVKFRDASRVVPPGKLGAKS